MPVVHFQPAVAIQLKELELSDLTESKITPHVHGTDEKSMYELQQKFCELI